MADEEKNTDVNSEQKSDEQVEQEKSEQVKEEALKNVQSIIEEKDEGEEEVDVNKDKSEESNKEDESKDADKDDKVKDDTTPNKEDKSDTTDKSVGKLDALNLPNRLIQAAKRNHISDDEVLSYGENAPTILSRLADASDQVSARLGELGRKIKLQVAEPKEKDKKSTPELKIDEDDSEETKTLKEIILGLRSDLSDVKKSITKDKETVATRESLERDRKVDGFFDAVSKDYLEFGKSEKLTEAEQLMRKSVWEKADDIQTGAYVNGTPITVEDALTQALSIYEGKNPRKVKEKIVKEVTEREKYLINRPKSKKSKTTAVKGNKGAVAAVTKILKERGDGGW